MSGERDALAEVAQVIDRVAVDHDVWPDAPFTNEREARYASLVYDLADAVLGSDWLAERDRRVRAEALREAANEIGDDWARAELHERAGRVEGRGPSPTPPRSSMGDRDGETGSAHQRALGPHLATADDVITGRARYADTPGGHADRRTRDGEADR